jgi:hypothetical protein
MIGLNLLAWHFILVIGFLAQTGEFLPNYFFDFYIYFILGTTMGLFWLADKKFGAEKIKGYFLKFNETIS